jgi:hypothetical protein
MNLQSLPCTLVDGYFNTCGSLSPGGPLVMLYDFPEHGGYCQQDIHSARQFQPFRSTGIA